MALLRAESENQRAGDDDWTNDGEDNEDEVSDAMDVDEVVDEETDD
ncbi:MAG TPA: hypothetical protein VIT41_11695 [Microlunatus sp.]